MYPLRKIDLKRKIDNIKYNLKKYNYKDKVPIKPFI